MIGEEGIRQAIEENGLTFGGENADFVVVGIDRSITYEKFAVGQLRQSEMAPALFPLTEILRFRLKEGFCRETAH